MDSVCGIIRDVLSPRLSRAFEGRQAVSKIAQEVLIVHISGLTFGADVVRVGPGGNEVALLTPNRPLQRLRRIAAQRVRPPAANLR